MCKSASFINALLRQAAKKYDRSAATVGASEFRIHQIKSTVQHFWGKALINIFAKSQTRRSKPILYTSIKSEAAQPAAGLLSLVYWKRAQTGSLALLQGSKIHLPAAQRHGYPYYLWLSPQKSMYESHRRPQTSNQPREKKVNLLL